MNALFLVSWFAFSYSFPLTINLGVRHAIASKAVDVERAINAPGVYFAKVSVIKGGRLRELKLTQRVTEE